jgi:hypothetical protein
MLITATRAARAASVRRCACLSWAGAARSSSSLDINVNNTDDAQRVHPSTPPPTPAPDPELVDFSAADAELQRSHVAVYRDFITQEQHDALVAQLTPVFKRRRYEKGHWDAVIEVSLIGQPVPTQIAARLLQIDVDVAPAFRHATA